MEHAGLRPLAFDKMEGLVREMQDAETGVPVRSQKLFLTSIPSAFMGYDLIEWLMERLNIEESAEALHIANQLCQCGYFFPVSDTKNLVVKDDSSLYRFQTPYYWPWQHRSPDNVEYAIYLVKRTLRNKQRHGLEDYEMDSLASLRKNLQNKWDFITMQAEEQVRLSKERKKGDKIVSDSQERAYWRVYRPPPGCINCVEPPPVPPWNRRAPRRRRNSDDLRREVDFLRSCLVRTRVKVSQALDGLLQYCSTYLEYDPMLTQIAPSNPWISDDPSYWQLNSPLVEAPTEKRVRRWGLSMEELVADPTGLQEFTAYLRKEYSHENIRFWLAVNDLRRSSQSQIHTKVKDIFDEFLAPGAPCEINIDGATMERVHRELRAPSRFTFDAAADHVYALLLKKDCYPRFVRSDHYRALLAAGVQPLQKKRFFGFGPGKKKSSTCTPPNPSSLQQVATGLGRRRGSERSLSGSVHELAIVGVKEIVNTRVTHSHSQSNLSDIPYRGDLPCHSKAVSTVWCSLDPQGSASADESSSEKKGNDVCPWESAETQPSVACSQEIDPEPAQEAHKKNSISVPNETYLKDSSSNQSASVCEQKSRKNSCQLDSASSSSDVSIAIAEVSERLKKTCVLQQSPSGSIDRERMVRAPSEEKVTVKMHQVRKYSTVSIGAPVDSRRGSVTTKLIDSNRPSVSSPEDFTQLSSDLLKTALPDKVSVSDKVEDQGLGIYKKTTGGRKKSTPLINVSSVVDVQETIEPTEEEEEEEAQAKAPSTLQSKPSVDATTSWEEGSDQPPPKTNEICPWEDEESCKVDAPFTKTYATLGYL